MQFCEYCFSRIPAGHLSCSSCGLPVYRDEVSVGVPAPAVSSEPAPLLTSTSAGVAPTNLETLLAQTNAHAVPDVMPSLPADYDPIGQGGVMEDGVPLQAPGPVPVREVIEGPRAKMIEPLIYADDDPPVLSARLTGWLGEEELEGSTEAPTPAENALKQGIFWLRRLFVVGLVTAVLSFLAGQLVLRNRASQAESYVRVQIGNMQTARETALREALVALQELYAELKERGGEDPSTSPAARQWRVEWRQRLQAVVMQYRLDGQVNFTRTHSVAESALRDAQLYLHSLEREWVSSVQASSPLSQKLEECLKEARDDLN